MIFFLDLLPSRNCDGHQEKFRFLFVLGFAFGFLTILQQSNPGISIAFFVDGLIVIKNNLCPHSDEQPLWTCEMPILCLSVLWFTQCL